MKIVKLSRTTGLAIFMTDDEWWAIKTELDRCDDDDSTEIRERINRLSINFKMKALRLSCRTNFECPSAIKTFMTGLIRS